MERPQLLAGAHVEAAHIARRRQLIARSIADHGADDDDIADDDRSGHELVLAPRDIAPDALERIDRAADPEALDRPAGPRVERPEIGVAGGQEDACRRAVRPVRDAARIEAGVRGAVALPDLGIEGPQVLAGGGVDRGRGDAAVL